MKFKILRNEVPYRFLTPWIGSTRENPEAIRRAQNYMGLCPYRFCSEGDVWSIEIHPVWMEYFVKNYAILKDFCLWNLANYFQSKNPSVPGICEKLSPEIKRPGLNRHVKLWEEVIETGSDVRCIYSGESLKEIPERDLDHFIPWSFVAHNQLWNLMPVDSTYNRQKHDRIPEVSRYVKDLAHNEKIFIDFYKDCEYKAGSPLSDFSTFGKSLKELAALSESDFCTMLANRLQPLEKIALASGFERWI